MKKIIILILLIPNIVLGETIYTDYELYLNTNEYLEETDILKRKEIILYNTYKQEIEEKYLSLDDKESKKYKIDYNDLIYEYKYSLEDSKYSESYQTKCLNEMYTPRSLTINNFNDNVKISEVIVSSPNLSGAGIGVTNYKGLMVHIANGIIEEEPVELNNESAISLSFFKNLDISSLKIKLYLPKQDIKKISFTITSKDGIKLTNEIYLTPNEDNVITITFDNNYYNFLEENKFSTTNNCISYYSLKVPLYKHTKLNNIPLNNYIPFNDSDLFIMDDYKINYNYYKREKIVLLDEIILSKKFKLKDYIVTSTIPIEELKVIDNINYEQDGNYLIDIYYKNNLLKSKDVKYVKEKNVDAEKVEDSNLTINQEIKTTITQPSTKKTTKNSTIPHTKRFKVISTEKQKMTTNNVKYINNKNIASVKENKFQKPMIITIISILIIILFIFECTLIYMKKKYF